MSQKKYNTNCLEERLIPSTKIPIRSASVPVFGYLSFLASNSAMANDLIALADHLRHCHSTT